MLSPIFTKSITIKWTLESRPDDFQFPNSHVIRYLEAPELNEKLRSKICTAFTFTRHGYLFSKVVYTGSSFQLDPQDVINLSKEAELGSSTSVALRINQKILQLNKKSA